MFFLILISNIFHIYIRFFNRGSEIQEEKNIKTRFSDVLGIDEFKEELIELVDYLKNPSKYHEAGAKLPKGYQILFYSKMLISFSLKEFF